MPTRTPPHSRSTPPAPRTPAATPRPNPEITPEQADARDLALLRAHRAGDQTALSELLTAYQDRLFGVCLRMLADPDEARDMTQDAMVRIIQGLHQFNGRSKLSTWMIRVAMNACLTGLRRKKLRRHVSLEDDTGSRYQRKTSDNASSGPTAGTAGHAPSHAAMEPDPASSVELAEERRTLYAALERLEPEQRAMLILRDMQGLDYRQIAEVLDVPEGTVKSRLFRARAALRERFEAIEGSSGSRRGD